jgi:two-component system OmpR family response regulator
MQPTNRRILCVDDDDSTCDLFEVLFAHIGHEVTTVTSPRQALALIRQGAFDLYILDTHFPQGSGIELCRALLQRTPAVPVVFYSSAARDEEQEAGVCAGAAAYIPKPHIDELIKTVQRLFNDQDGASALPGGTT